MFLFKGQRHNNNVKPDPQESSVRRNLPAEETISSQEARIYAPDTVSHLGIPVENLIHSFDPVRIGKRDRIDLAAAHSCASLADGEVRELFRFRTGKAFDRYHASPEETRMVQEAFYANEKFIAALEHLEIEKGLARLITLPWWNELAGGEVSFEFEEGIAQVVLQEKHSYETQIMRAGIERAVQNVSVAGVVLTAPDPITHQRKLALGLRGGKSYSNTFHCLAGALHMTEELRAGSSSIFSVFVETELGPEMGLVRDDISKATLCLRIYDRQIDQGPSYVFLLETNLREDEISARWAANPNPDKAEHQELLFLPFNTKEVRAFISKYYRGAVTNRPRGDNERYLLHPGALILAGLSGMAPEELQLYRRKGEW